MLNHSISPSAVYFLLVAGACITTNAIAQHPNIQINNPASTDPEEVTIAINPVDPLNLVAGANIVYNYTSHDGGKSWTQGGMTSTYGVWGDPSVIFDARGFAYYGHLSYPPVDSGYWIDRIVVQRSTDGGGSWNSGVGIGYNPPARQQDKEWLAADLTDSPYRNNLYVAWTQFDSYGSASPLDSSRILFSRSTDAGLSWSAPVRVSDVAGNCLDSDSTVEGAVPAVGPNGEVYLSWGGPLGIMFDKSTDGGRTFGTDLFVTTQPGGWDFNVSGIYRCNGMPVTACDVSSSPYRGNIYIQWSDQRNGVDNTDIFFIKSTNGGQSWGSVKRVNDDTTSRQQFFSWMTVDQTTGAIYVVFYDRRNTTGDATGVTVARSTDGGDTFVNFPVSDSSFTPQSGTFFGDYINIAARYGKVYPIWMRLDNTTLSVWTAPFDDGMRTGLSVHAGWNMVSLPLETSDARVSAIFPSASSHAFTYDTGYVIKDTLQSGIGYWIKYPAAQTVSINGSSMFVDTIPVAAGWNMIGSTTVPLPVSSIGSVPSGLTTSEFFTYRGGGYTVSDTIEPGVGYWIKSSQPGKLIVSTAAGTVPSGRVRIVADAELPPPPPEAQPVAAVPAHFSLDQNYPNPFNPVTKISYQTAVPGVVWLDVFDMIGRRMMRLVGKVQPAGPHEVTLDASRLASGVYYYRLESGGRSAVRKMEVVR